MKKFSQQEIDKFVSMLDFSKIEGGLVPMIAQDYLSNQVLMLAFANEAAVRQSLETGIACYYSRSRKKLWKKGEESGHVQEIQQVFVDCYMDTILLKVKQNVAACHTGHFSCFYREFTGAGFTIQGEKIFDPDEVYQK
ncbi:MAG: phosphoribosyl-AMP cyclohydrolase [Candidatus Lokiarchaeota archaeon]|nr:phosphoribosyl-AMP cyclohydrolase [Candidatus Lokiarchaeota archaeon]